MDDDSVSDDEQLNENIEESTPEYTFDELIHLIDISDPNNPDKEQQEDAENKLRELGFYNEDGEIREENFNKSFKTSDGKTLTDLDKYFDEHYM